ncbi:methyltransferase domain-containing protein [Oleiagrimonas sp.]|jgi:SAM-dependent methyltransferase|uniref:class I SAM-dependent methyltransferase n=1 Tax=Oleiagrimonas sp. TaxID=2010330 RepID=UPI00260294A7|nr:methyltransferase domain-containing protein [Oleiagrimonas sp.]MDA3913200.1 methyltransferase domain-containing protein [Oleiagrimonas sp.]
MLAPIQALYATPAMRGLLRAETAVLTAFLGTRPATHGLYLAMHSDPRSMPDPVARWAHLYAAGDEWHGPLRARVDTALPFADDSFAVVVISHVHQHVDDCGQLIREAERVIEPEGLVILVGLHPMSPWMPWVCWQMRGMQRAMHMIWPFRIGQDMLYNSLDMEASRRFGAVVPRDVDLSAGNGYSLGGGYMLVARKRRRAPTKLKFRSNSKQLRMSGALAPGTHRECA